MKHIPMRSCIVCRRQKEKSELMRIVREPRGAIVIDPCGRLPGRGAYVCKEGDCLNVAIKKHILNKTFKQQLPQQVYDELEAEHARIYADKRE